MKAITPVIATVMLMLITVGMVGMTYTWFSNMMTTQTEKNIAIPVGGVQCVNNKISAIVTNAGANSNITDDDIVIADVNGVNVRNTPFFGGFNTNGLVGYWRFENESSDGKYAYDYSSYGNTGTLTSMNTTGNATSGWNDTCKIGKCLNFDGVNDYVNVGSGTVIENAFKGPFSMGLWFYGILPYKENYAFWADNTGYPHLRQYYLSADANSIQFLINFADGAQGAYSTANMAHFNSWVYAVGTWDGTYIRLYVNGQQAGISANYFTKTLANGAGPFMISTSDTRYTAHGLIDEVTIWNRVLSPDEVTQLNKTNAGNFTMAPNKAVTLINSYPVFSRGKYTVRIGTRNGVIERTVECL